MYFEHQLIGAYKHVGSTEVDHEFTIDGIQCKPHVRPMTQCGGDYNDHVCLYVLCTVDKNKPYSSDSESDVEIENEMSNPGSSNECSSDAETSDRVVNIFTIIIIVIYAWTL